MLHRIVVRFLAVAVLLAAGPAAAGPGGTLIVLNKSDATASLLDPATGDQRALLPTGDGPHEAAVSPDGRIVVVGDYGTRDAAGSTLTVLDLPGAKVSRTVALTLDGATYHRPHGLAFLDDRRVVVTCERERAVLIVDVVAGRVERAIATDQDISHMLALAPGGERAFVANIGSGTMTVLDLDAGRKVADVATGEGAEGIAVSPDGAEVWVTNRAADTVTVVDADTLANRATIALPGFPIRATFTPDGRHVLVSLARAGAVAVLDAAKRSVVATVRMDARPGNDRDQRLFGDRFGDSPVPIGILIPPAGDRAYVANTNADVVTVIDLATFEIEGRLTAGREPDGMAWSPGTITTGGGTGR